MVATRARKQYGAGVTRLCSPSQRLQVALMFDAEHLVRHGYVLCNRIVVETRDYRYWLGRSHDTDAPPDARQPCRTGSVAEKGFGPPLAWHDGMMAERGRAGKARHTRTQLNEHDAAAQGFKVMGSTWRTNGLAPIIPGLWLERYSSRVEGRMGFGVVGETRGRVGEGGGGGGGGWRQARPASAGTCPAVGGVHGRPQRWGPALYLRLAAEVPHPPPSHSSRLPVLGPSAGRQAVNW